MTRMHLRIAAGLLAATSLTAITAPAAAQANAAGQIEVNIPAGDLAKSLQSFARQSRTQVIFSAADLRGRRTQGVSGRMTPAEALQQLVAGSGAALVQDSSGAFLVRPQAEPGNAGAAETAAPKGEEAGAEIVVTGTNIKGLHSQSSPASVFTREDINASGVGTLADLAKRIPQNFGGGASDATISGNAGGGTANNIVSGDGMNLRGLGSDATLVLINSRRVAPGNTGNFVDISLIPLSAVDRMEVVPDGASAIYGSDAVGGVVNILLRRQMHGAESRIRYGSGRGGTPDEIELSQAGGLNWKDGSAVATYDYYGRTALSAGDRPFADQLPLPFSLLSKQRRHSAALSLRQDISSHIELTADGLYAHRDAVRQVSNTFGFAAAYDPTIDFWTESVGLHFDLTNNLDAKISASTSGTKTHLSIVQPKTGEKLVDNLYDTRLTSVDPVLSGTLLTLPAGDVKFAIGGQLRHETLNYNSRLKKSRFTPGRDIWAAFGELNVPLIANPRLAKALLEINGAMRYEHYSDFGSTSNPHIGINLRPTKGIRLYGNYATSFKAPQLIDLNPIITQTGSEKNFDPLTGKDEIVLLKFGGNANLKPETAKSWSAGLEAEPPSIPGLKLSVNYFRVNYTNRIATVQGAGFSVLDVLRSETLLGPDIVKRNPDIHEVQALIANPNYFNDVGTFDPNSVVAIIDSRSLNLAADETRGIDFSAQYSLQVGVGRIQLGVDGTHIFELHRKVRPLAPIAPILDTYGNPVDLKLRGSAIYRSDRLVVAAYVNYIGGYSDTRVTPSASISSWTTGDISISYDFNSSQGLLSGLGVMLSVQNVTNENPPWVVARNRGYPIEYDAANANALGRFISFQLTKHW